MSGHSKWATTKHKKVAIDARRGKLFARLIKGIRAVVRIGSGNPAGNSTLFDAVRKARKNSVPTDNITCAVERDSGEEVGDADWQTAMYEGYDLGGVTFLVKCLTDNRNRTASDVCMAFSHNGGDLADPGSAIYNFTRKGAVEVAKADDVDEDSILMVILEAGTGEVENVDESSEICSEPGDIVAMCIVLTKVGMDYGSAKAQFVAGTRVEVDVREARKIFRLIDALEDLDDVQNAYTLVDLSPEVAAEFADGED